MEQHDPHHYARGGQQFNRDIGAGQPRLYWNTRGQWGEYLTRLMRERFGVDVEWTSDIVSHEDLAFWAGNNDAVAAHVDQKHGEGAYQAVLDEVWRFRQEVYDRWEAAQKDRRPK